MSLFFVKKWIGRPFVRFVGLNGRGAPLQEWRLVARSNGLAESPQHHLNGTEFVLGNHRFAPARSARVLALRKKKPSFSNKGEVTQWLRK